MNMTDEQLTIIEARAGVAKTGLAYPGIWQLDTAAISFIHEDVPLLLAEIKRQRDMLQEFYLACVYLDKAIPVYGRTNAERIRAAADEIVALRARLNDSQ